MFIEFIPKLLKSKSRTFSNPVTHECASLDFKWKHKFSRDIKLNHTNIALLLHEATQKHKKLTDY